MASPSPRKPVTVRISAYEEAGRLHIKVKDDGEAAAEDDEDGGSTGVGLRNVCDRLDHALRPPRRLHRRPRSRTAAIPSISTCR